VTVAVSNLLVSATLVAVTVYVPAALGAVYKPACVIAPWFAGTDQVTAVLVVPITVAVNVCVPPAWRFAVFGETETATMGTAVTVTAHVAVLLPSCVKTYIVAVPAAAAVTVADRPLPDTDATVLLLLDQETFLFVASLGTMVAVRVSVAPTVRLDEFLLRVTPVTDTGVVETVTEQVAVLLPSCVVTVMVAVPSATAVTVADRPLPDTDATELLLLDHVTFLFVALLGAMVAVRLSVAPTLRLEEFLLRVTPVTETGVDVTVTAQVAVLPPSWVVAVMLASPAATPMTVPLLTCATAVLLLFHVTFLLVALLGAMMAVRLSVPPMAMLVEVLFRDTPVTAMDVGGVSWSLGKKPLPLPQDMPKRSRASAAMGARRWVADFFINQCSL
jgi:hypothetical protein